MSEAGCVGLVLMMCAGWLMLMFWIWYMPGILVLAVLKEALLLLLLLLLLA
jgi:hypothetical protein